MKLIETDDVNIIRFSGGAETLNLTSAWIGCAMGGQGWHWEVRGPNGNTLGRSGVFCASREAAIEEGRQYIVKVRQFLKEGVNNG